MRRSKQKLLSGTTHRSFFLTAALIIICLPGLSFSAGDTTSGSTSGWLTFRGNSEHTGKISLIGPPEEVELQWRWRVYYEESAISASPAVTADGVIYTATEGGYLGVINSGGGSSWIYNVSDTVKSSPAVDTSGNVLAITSGGYMYYLNSKGELQWKSDFAVGISSSPVLSGDIAYVGTDDNALLAVTVTPDLTKAASESRLIPAFYVKQWSFRTRGPVTSSPAFAGNTVFFGADNYVYALNPASAGQDNATALVKWEFNVHSQINSSPAVYNGAVYIGADDGYLYALKENVSDNSSQGELIWKRKTDGSIASSPAIDTPASGETDTDAMIYVGSDDGKLYAIDVNGELQWTFSTLGPIISSPLVDGNGDIYFGSDDGAIYALFPDGSLKWKYQTAGKVRSSPVIGPDKKLYVGSEDGLLYCIGESTQEGSKQDIKINVSLSLSSIENKGNPTTISATITSDSEGTNVLSRIASVVIDLNPLNLMGILSSGDPATGNFEIGSIGKEIMLDDGLYEDDVAGDGVFTYAFGLTDDASLITWDEGIYSHFPVASLGVGPVPLMVTVTDLYGNRTSKPFALNIDQKTIGVPDFQDSITSNLNNQTLNISFTSGTPSILSITPSSGQPGTQVNVVIVGQNTNFFKNKTRVEIFNKEGFRIASALPENDGVSVTSETTLSAKLNIITTQEVKTGSLIDTWDVTVTTEFSSTSKEVVVGSQLFTITSSTAASIHEIAVPQKNINYDINFQQSSCVFTLDITNSSGARPKDAPWMINTGYSRDITIEKAQSGVWNFNITMGECPSTPSFKIITTGSNFGYITGEVRDAMTGDGIDNATITALTGESMDTPVGISVSSGGGYYMLPLSAAEQNYTVTASKNGFIDIHREIDVQDGKETALNFSLLADVNCPVSQLANGNTRQLFYQFRDKVLLRSGLGKRWVKLYYAHANEVKDIMSHNPEIKEKVKTLVSTMAAAIPVFLHTGRVDAMLQTDVQDLIDMLHAKASPQLKRALNAERITISRYLDKVRLQRSITGCTHQVIYP